MTTNPMHALRGFFRPAALAAACGLALAGCGPAPQSALPLPPAFYPSALALGGDGLRVGGGLSGEVVRVDGRGGLERLRAAGGEPVLRLESESHAPDSAFWLLLPGRVERRAADGALLSVWMLAAGVHAVDLVAWRPGNAFVLAADGRLLRLTPEGVREHARVAASRRFAALRPGDAADAAARLLEVDGALAAFPESGALLAVNDAGAWRIDAASGAAHVLDFWPGFTRVSQIVRTGEVAGRHRIAVLRGGANEVRLATITRDLRRAVPVAAARAAHEAPYRGAWDGSTLHVLLGGLDHHPRLAGDGRPRPHRVARWAIGAEPVHTAESRATPHPPGLTGDPARP